MIVFAIVSLICGIVSIICGLGVIRSEREFQANHKTTTGMLTGYYIRDNTKWDVPQVIMTVDDIEKKEKCKSKRMNSRTCPAGAELKVIYMEKKTLGIKHYDLRIDEEQFRPYSPIGAAWFLIGFGVVMVGIAVIFLSNI